MENEKCWLNTNSTAPPAPLMSLMRMSDISSHAPSRPWSVERGGDWRDMSSLVRGVVREVLSSQKYGRAPFQSEARLTPAPLLIFRRHLDSGTHNCEFCVPLSRSHPNRAKRSSVRCASVFVQVQTRRLAARQHGTTSLILRDLPLKERFTVVDTVSIPTPTPLRNPIRARAEKCLLTTRAREKSASFRWVLTDKILEL